MPIPWSGTRRVKCKGDSEPGFGERLLFVSCDDPFRTKDYLSPVRVFHDVSGFSAISRFFRKVREFSATGRFPRKGADDRSAFVKRGNPLQSETACRTV